MPRFSSYSEIKNASIFDSLKAKEEIIMKYECKLCGYVYDPAEGDPDNDVAPGTPFKEIPEDWVCPLCGAGKEEFKPL